MLISGPNTIEAGFERESGTDGVARKTGFGPNSNEAGSERERKADSGQADASVNVAGQSAEKLPGLQAGPRAEGRPSAGAEASATRVFPREGVVRFIVPELPLFGGEYLFSASVYNENLSVAYDHHELQYSFQVIGGKVRDFGLIKIKADWKLGE